MNKLLVAGCWLSVVLALNGCRAQAPQATSHQQRATATRSTHVLRVCSDPNNLPFSNRQQEGFENEIASLIARDLHADVQYTWWAQRRGFLRNTLKAHTCDVVMGLPSAVDMAATTRPYYRSTYVFVSRRDRNIHVASFDDPVLKKLKIGVQIIGDDGADSPPAHALAARGITDNVRGYTVYGDYSKPNPPARIVDAVANGEVDLAVVWGPLAGYFAKHENVPMNVVPVSPEIDLPFLPFVYDIAIGVRREDANLRQELDDVLERRKPDIDRILASYGVPRLDTEM
ncbi:MAG TPA: substrate-binding domain-containing protein [Thermoanaerobaculia bacterium]|nr:substrate-binding domain-containing protein [Thermoanaerobaculia bacterium]